jgi:pre-mRNA-splicing factor CDC5/CEF1
MRILIKGGVWKNTEDEILKAAVMKYGKNQWARVASLMNRKSSKQCKARWYEWLDPSIKKTEWNKEEEEKLLHMAKIMPNQWRTIAPIVGRTAPQCMEHYERLLDQAQEGNEGILDDTRRLRPGEIDPAPETKPARPDPIDMDEDEKEMLSEARARLANTKGKKAKRKARERQLEESRRLSMLQKRRELKAAGIESKLGGGGKRKYIDYAKEIPFQKVPPAGFYDVGAENDAGKKQFIDPVKHGLELSRMEGRHQKEEEDREKQKDKKRLKTLFAANAPQAIMNISKTNDPTSLRRRSELALPSPQVSESELEDIVKQGQRSLMPPPSEGRSSTQALVGDYTSHGAGGGGGGLYSATPSAPQRTPMQENVVLQEARNLRALREITPFAAAQTEDELPDMEFLQRGTGFESITPRDNSVATPNVVLRTPQIEAGGAGAGGSSVVSIKGTSRATPMLRDQFGLNEWQAKSLAVGGTPAPTPSSTPMSEFTHDNSDAFSVSDISTTSEVNERAYYVYFYTQLLSVCIPFYVLTSPLMCSSPSLSLSLSLSAFLLLSVCLGNRSPTASARSCASSCWPSS